MVGGCYLCGFLPLFAGIDPGEPLFADNFDTPLTLAENWVGGPGWSLGRACSWTNGALSLKGTLSPRRATPANCYVEFDVSFLPDEEGKTDGRVGFLGTPGWCIKSDGYRFGWMGKKLPRHAKGKPVRMGFMRRCSASSAECTLFINGVGLESGSFPLPDGLRGIDPPPDGDWDAWLARHPDIKVEPLWIYQYGFSCVIVDAFRLCRLSGGGGSPNLLTNASFEHDYGGFPCRWSRGNNYDWAKAGEMPYGDWIGTWSLDRNEKHSGKVSLKIVNDEKSGSDQSLRPWNFSTVKGSAGAFSAWLKADRTNFPVTLIFGGRHEFRVGTEWTRCEAVWTNLPDRGLVSPAQICFREKGTLWVDDVQAEPVAMPTADDMKSGRTFATPFRLADSDTWRFAKREPSENRVKKPCRPVLSDPQGTNAPPVSVLGRLSFYMNEPEAAFRIKTSLPEPEKLTAELVCAGRKVTVPAAVKFEMRLPLNGITYGTNEVAVTLRDGRGEAVGEAKTRLIKRRFWKGATQVNHFSRALLHGGEPVVPVSPFLGDMHFTHVMTPEIVAGKVKWLALNGFKSAEILIPLADSPDRQPKIGRSAGAFFGAALAEGIDVLLWTGPQQWKDGKPATLPDDVLRDGYDRLDYPNILTQILTDEQDLGQGIPALNDLRRGMLRFFPYHPVQNNYTFCALGSLETAEDDIYMIDDYLTNNEGRDVRSVVGSVEAMWRAGIAEGKPCFFFLVSANMTLHGREPTYDEQIAQTYGCLAAGCAGFAYFCGEPCTPGNWRAMRQVNEEILSLTDVIASEEEIAQAVCDGDGELLLHRTFLHKGALTIVACNIDEFDAGKVTFTLPAGKRLAKRAEVLFENRTVKIRDGRLADDFAGHARHVYRIGVGE